MKFGLEKSRVESWGWNVLQPIRSRAFDGYELLDTELDTQIRKLHTLDATSTRTQNEGRNQFGFYYLSLKKHTYNMMYYHTGPFDRNSCPYISLYNHHGLKRSKNAWEIWICDALKKLYGFFCRYFIVVQIWLNISAAIIQIQISHEVLLLLIPLGLDEPVGWTVESKFSVRFRNLNGIGFKSLIPINNWLTFLVNPL